MVWTLIVTAALAAKPAAPVKLAVPALSGLNLGADELAFYTEHLAQQLTLAGLQVTTAKQISTLLGMERQRIIMGCKDVSTSCMAELAAALGADGVVSGSVGKLQSSFRINVSIVAATDGRTLAAYSARAGSSDEVVEDLTEGAKQMAAEVTRALRGAEPPAPPAPDLHATDRWSHTPNVRPEGPAAPAPPGPALRKVAWIPAAGAGALAVVGTVFAVQANARYGEVTAWRATGADPSSYDTALATAAAGKTDQLVAGISYGVAGAGLAAAVILYLTGDPASAPASAVRVAPANGGVALTWSWP